GKTALAATLASAYAQQPSGVLWLNTEDDTLEALLVRVGRAYEITDITTTDNPTAMVGAVAATLTQHKPLLVLDGKLDAQIAAKFITRCADRLPVLVLNREPLEGPWATVELQPLDSAQAVAMFKQECGLTTPDQDPGVLQLVNLLGRLPFALGVAARAMLASKQTPAAYASVLNQVMTTTAGNPSQAALAASFGALNGALQGVILIMGATFRGEATPEMLSLISGAPNESIQQAMNMLVQLRLAERSVRYNAPYYRLHSITYAFAQARLTSSDRLKDLQQKVRDAALAYAQKYSVNTPDAHNRLAAELENCLAVARWAVTQGQRDIGAALLTALNGAGNFGNERGYVYELTRLRGMGAATAFPAYPPEPVTMTPEELLIANLLPDEDDTLDYDGDDLDDDDDDALLAEAEDDFDDDEAELDDELYEDVPEDEVFSPTAVPMVIPFDDLEGLRAALNQARQLSDKPKQVEILRGIGKLQTAQGMNTEALTIYDEALALYETLDEREGTLEMLEMLSTLMVKTENAQAAVLNATRGLKLSDELGDVETRLQLLMTLGDARQQLGESQLAAELYGQALAMTRHRGDSQHEALALYKLGYAQLDNADAQSAIDTWEQALKLFRTQLKHDYEGKTLGALGAAYGDLERWQEAINFHTSALYIAREVKDQAEEALNLVSLGYANGQSDQLGQALLRYRQALHIAYVTQQRANIVTTVLDLARLLLKSPRHLNIAELLIDDAIAHEPNDKDARTLKERVTNEKLLAVANGVAFLPVNGTARDYAANAYKLL
ncbi:MAG: tetratricopeptide repeat protein, partial [Armatimonadetes bacterium]|nr:tetratricopeptide repeat protein [Anaerolineae bacterium]